MIRTTLIALAASLALAGSAMAGDWKKLITAAELKAMQADSAPLILDIRAAKNKKGGPSYAKGHIPGAVSAPYPRWRGPKENPGETLSDAKLTELLQSLGVTRDKPTVVVHQGRDGTDFGAAARVYWTLKSSGVSHIAILNGGVTGWEKAKLTLSTDAVTPDRSAITASLSDQWLATRADIEGAVGAKDGPALLDARPMRQFLGFSKHKAAKTSGTLEGSLNFSQAQWFDHNGAMMSMPAQASAISQTIGLKPDVEVYSFCNTGHWAATNWFALSELAGHENVRMYPGSMVEWTNTGGDVVTPGE